ncbi:MAG: DNA polymerase III subunit delta [Kiritimatiellia bacterium]|jgi:DNA polymerase-3 subunit delta|nr:DNA polymerase III subunit delta [Kiritimatiellia bacterium]
MSSAIHLIFGDDEFRVTSTAKEVISGVISPEEQTLGLEIVDAKADTVDGASGKLDQAFESLQTPGFMGSDKVVWLRDAGFLADTVVGRSETVKTKVNELAALIKQGLLPGQHLVVTAPKVDKRYSFYKTCKQYGSIQEFSIPDRSYQADQQAAAFLRTVIPEKGLKMPRDVLLAFVERVGTDSRQLLGELDKLDLFLGDRREVKPEDIRAITCSSREAIVWDLTDAVGNRHLARSLEMIRQLSFQKQSPIGLVMMMGSRIRELMIYREAINRRWLVRRKNQSGKSAVAWGDVPPEAETMFKEWLTRDPRSTHPFRVGLLAKQANLFSAKELEHCHREIVAAHESLVSTAVPGPLVLELLIVRMLA